MTTNPIVHSLIHSAPPETVDATISRYLLTEIERNHEALIHQMQHAALLLTESLERLRSAEPTKAWSEVMRLSGQIGASGTAASFLAKGMDLASQLVAQVQAFNVAASSM